MEPVTDAPLVGLVTGFDSRRLKITDDPLRRQVDLWNRYWQSGRGDKSLVVHDDRMAPTSHSGGTWIPAGHASFIADSTVMEAVVRRITGRTPIRPAIDLMGSMDVYETKSPTAES